MRTTVLPYKIRRSCLFHARLVSLNGVITASFRATTTRNVGGTIRVLETWDASYAEETARILGRYTSRFGESQGVCCCDFCWTQSSLAERSSFDWVSFSHTLYMALYSASGNEEC
jgi:hypothetical protein